jgi:hypothetical protein
VRTSRFCLVRVSSNDCSISKIGKSSFGIA